MTGIALKQPGETATLTLPFPPNRPLTGLVSIAVVARGLVVGASPVAAVGGFGAGLVTATVSGGTDGERYLVTARATAAGGDTLEAELEVAVIEGTWAMPDGGAPYLSIADFVRRFGLDDVILMTDRTGLGRIDRDYLVEQLIDAQAEADAHLAGRYSLPLATVPRIVAMSIADRTRGRLYPRGAPEGVADAAKAALRTLERIQSGALPLGLAEPAAAGASDAPVLVAAGRRQYPDGLANY